MIHRWMDKWLDRWFDWLMDRLMVGWMDRKMDGWSRVSGTDQRRWNVWVKFYNQRRICSLHPGEPETQSVSFQQQTTLIPKNVVTVAPRSYNLIHLTFFLNIFCMIFYKWNRSSAELLVNPFRRTKNPKITLK